jgi:hypothetical protein
MTTVSRNKANQMERLTTCPICLDKFRIPKVLPCMHTFCLTPCLTNLVDPRARSLRCPECRREHQIPAGMRRRCPCIVTIPDRCFICKEQKQSKNKLKDYLINKQYVFFLIM